MTDDTREILAWLREIGHGKRTDHLQFLNHAADLIERISAERDRMRSALEFYADEAHWRVGLDAAGEYWHVADDDHGNRARAALKDTP